MDIGKAVTFVFEDDQWISKLLLGAAISLVPLLGAVTVTGYTITVLRNVEAGKPRPLPGWEDLVQHFVDGLTFWVATLVYSIPFIVLACPIALVWILPAVAGDNQDLTTVLASVAGILTAGLGCLALLYAVLLWLLTPALQIRYAQTENLASCLRFGEVFRFLFDNIGAVLIAQVLIWAAGLVVTSILGTIIGALSVVPICGWVIGAALGLVMLPAGVWVLVFGSHLYGQIARGAEAGGSVV
jgi:hypothetical protein